jgi:hypothetical protein
MADLLQTIPEFFVEIRYKTYKGKSNILRLKVTDKKIEGFEKFCVPKLVVTDYWKIVTTFVEEDRWAREVPIIISDPVSSKEILDYVDICRRRNFTNVNCPAWYIIADYLGHEEFVTRFFETYDYKKWTDAQKVRYHRVFYGLVAPSYIEKTFLVHDNVKHLGRTSYFFILDNIRFEISKKDLKEYGYRRDDESLYYLEDTTKFKTAFQKKFLSERRREGRQHVDFEISYSPENIICNGDSTWLDICLRIYRSGKNLSVRKVGHATCLKKFLTSDPLIAKKILHESREQFIAYANIAVKLRHRVRTLSYEELLESLHPTNECEVAMPSDQSLFRKAQRETRKHFQYDVDSELILEEWKECREQKVFEKVRDLQSKRDKQEAKLRRGQIQVGAYNPSLLNHNGRQKGKVFL